MTALSDAATRLVWRRRDGIALALGFASLLLAILAVLGPARERTRDYLWPPSSLPAASPTKAWYAPLFLSSRKPEAVTVRLPCTLPPALPGVTSRPSGAIVLATSRNPESHTRLALWRLEHSVVLTIKERPITRIPWPPAGAGEPGCERVVRVAGNRWDVLGPAEHLLDSGRAPPFVVTGLLSELDLRSAPRPTVTVTAEVLGTTPTRRQVVVTVAAALLALVALALALAPRRRRDRGRAGDLMRSGVRSLGIVDAGVVSLLLVWWMIGPTFTDDGWVLIRERNFADSGTFATYFDNTGAAQPFGYWYEWLHHWLALATTSPPLIRLPVLVIGIVSWFLCRWLLARMVPRHSPRLSVRVTLAAGFLVGFLSWGLTLRPEPIVSLLAGMTLATMVSFALRPALALLVAAGVFVTLAVAAHPEGVVALAPVAACAGPIASWLRLEGRRLAIAMIASASAVMALGLLLFFVDSDYDHRSGDSTLIQARSQVAALDWRDEIIRYVRLSDPEWGTTLRRASVALMLLALVAGLVRRRSDALADLAARSLAFGFVALLITPSKWPWHFGALVVLGAVTVAVESARLADDDARRRWSIRPLLVILVVLGAATWAWSYRSRWSPVDVRTFGWPPNLGDVIGPLGGLDLSSLVVWILLIVDLIAIAAIVSVVRNGRRGLPAVPWSVAVWIVPIVALPLLVVTVGTLARDAAATEGWTLTRQSLGSLVGRDGCGLADDLLLPDPKSFRALRPISRPVGPSTAASLGPPPLSGLDAWGPLSDGSTPDPVVTPWFVLPPDGRVGLFVAGHTDRLRTLGVQWASTVQGGINILSEGRADARLRAVDANRTFAWRFLAAGDLPHRPPGARFVRFLADNRHLAPDWALAFTGPVRYDVRTMTVAAAGARTLVHPALGLYLPCARQPALAHGIVEEPDTLVLLRTGIWPLDDVTSPFTAVLDAHSLVELSTSDSRLPASRLAIFAVDRSPRPGEAVARAVAQP